MSRINITKVSINILVILILIGTGCVSVIKPGMSKEEFLTSQGKEPVKKTNKGGYEIWTYDEGVIRSWASLGPLGVYVGNIVFFKDGKYITNRSGMDLDKIRDEYLDSVLDEKIVIGMTKDEVFYSWPGLHKISETVGGWGVHEQWIKGSIDDPYYYLYFENGVLTSWQGM
ncbi:MAG: hypothetical protein V1701_02325 [Planctomycetota bacterium]